MNSQLVEETHHIVRPPRWECTGEIVVIDESGRELMGRLGNVSDGGFMAECEQKIPKGSVVETTLPDRGRVRAEVRWVLGWRFGAMILPDAQ
jgi:hypothetical protein